MISTRDLSGMPDLRGFRKLARSLAMLDAIMSPESDVDAVYRHSPLTPALANRLNPSHDLAALATDIAEIGYPDAD